MPHLTVEYSANLEEDVDIAGFCAVMRDAMLATGIFPLGGIRVRAFPCHTYVIADGDPRHAYVNLICRIGAGRDAETRLAAAEAIYAAAEGHLKARVGERPVALSLDLDELHPRTSLKRYNTIHDALKAKS
jgi:5-carboxymethyl-2-hydroxymuconate isomerase